MKEELSFKDGMISNVEGQTIAHLDKDDKRGFLFAVAPELLSILKAIIEVWDEHKIIGPTMYHDARAAIARAEGGA